MIQVDGVIEELIADPATIASEIQFLTSPAFLIRMVEQLDLLSDPEFNGALREDADQPSVIQLLNPMRYVPESWLAKVSSPQVSSIPAPDPAVLQLNRVVRAFGGGLEIEQIGGAYIIGLDFTAKDPAKAAMIANAMADEYLVSQVEAQVPRRRARHRMAQQTDPGTARRGPLKLRPRSSSIAAATTWWIRITAILSPSSSFS